MNRFELLPDEKIIIENPKHWKNYIIPAIAMCASLGGVALRLSRPLVSVVNLVVPGTLPDAVVLAASYAEAIIMVLLLAAVSAALVDLAHTRYYVTDRRIVSISGWLNVRMSDMLLERIETVSLSQKISERIFNSGDILCVSAGASLYLDDVYDARRFRQTVMEMMTRYDSN